MNYSRSTYRPGPRHAARRRVRLRIYWGRVLGVIAMALALIAFGAWGLAIWDAAHPEPTPASSSVSMPASSVPVWDSAMPICTDAIADAHGICKGEPLPPCPTEDSTQCYWDGATMGNGTGRSWVALDGFVIYTDGLPAPAPGHSR